MCYVVVFQCLKWIWLFWDIWNQQMDCQTQKVLYHLPCTHRQMKTLRRPWKVCQENVNLIRCTVQTCEQKLPNTLAIMVLLQPCISKHSGLINFRTWLLCSKFFNTSFFTWNFCNVKVSRFTVVTIYSNYIYSNFIFYFLNMHVSCICVNIHTYILQ